MAGAIGDFLGGKALPEQAAAWRQGWRALTITHRAMA
jgi:hypothetical protein